MIFNVHFTQFNIPCFRGMDHSGSELFNCKCVLIQVQASSLSKDRSRSCAQTMEEGAFYLQGELSDRVTVLSSFFDACSLAIAQALCRGHLTSNLISLLWCCTILRYPVSEHLRPEGNSELTARTQLRAVHKTAS